MNEILRLKCTKISAWAPPQTRLGSLQCSPGPELDLRGLLLRGGKRGKREEKGRENRRTCPGLEK